MAKRQELILVNPKNWCGLTQVRADLLRSGGRRQKQSLAIIKIAPGVKTQAAQQIVGRQDIKTSGQNYPKIATQKFMHRQYE
jgi:hypothetical protein